MGEIASAMMSGIQAHVTSQTSGLEQQEKTIYKNVELQIDNYIAQVQSFLKRNDNLKLGEDSILSQLKNIQGLDNLYNIIQRKSNNTLQQYNDNQLIQQGYRLLMNIRSKLLYNKENTSIEYMIAFQDAGTVQYSLLSEEEYLQSLSVAENGLSAAIDTKKFYDNLIIQNNEYSYNGKKTVDITKHFANFYNNIAERILNDDKFADYMHKLLNEAYSRSEIKARKKGIDLSSKSQVIIKRRGMQRALNNRDNDRQNKININTMRRWLIFTNSVGKQNSILNNGFVFEAIITQLLKQGDSIEDLSKLFNYQQHHTDAWKTYGEVVGNKAFYRGGDVENYQLKLISKDFSAHGIALQTVVNGFMELKYICAAKAKGVQQSKIREATELVLTGCQGQAQVAESNILNKLQALLG